MEIKSLLSIEKALEKLALKSRENVRAFYCSKFSREGILIFSDTINFGYLSDENEDGLKFEPINTALIQAAEIVTGNDKKGIIDFKYGKVSLKFNFYEKQDLLDAKAILNGLLPGKVTETDFSSYTEREKKLTGLSRPLVNHSVSLDDRDSIKEEYRNLNKSTKVSNKFLEVASHTILNYQAVELKKKEPEKEPPKPQPKPVLPGTAGPAEIAPAAIKTETPKPEGKKAETAARETAPATSPVQPWKEPGREKIRLKNDLAAGHNKINQNARVSDKFMEVASNNVVTYYQVAGSVPQKKKTKIPVQAIMTKALFFGGVFFFIKSPYFNIVRGYVYQAPGKVSGSVEVFKDKRCELELKAIGKTVFYYHKKNKAFPADFPQFVRKAFESSLNSDPSRDPWGNPYQLEKTADGFKISTNGPDGKKGTADDKSQVFIIDASYTLPSD